MEKIFDLYSVLDHGTMSAIYTFGKGQNSLKDLQRKHARHEQESKKSLQGRTTRYYLKDLWTSSLLQIYYGPQRIPTLFDDWGMGFSANVCT